MPGNPYQRERHILTTPAPSSVAINAPLRLPRPDPALAYVRVVGDPRLLLVAVTLLLGTGVFLRQALAGKSPVPSITCYLAGVAVTVVWSGTLHTQIAVLNEGAAGLRVSNCYGEDFQSCFVPSRLPVPIAAGATGTVKIRTRETVHLVLWSARGTPTCLAVRPVPPRATPSVSVSSGEACPEAVVAQIQTRQQELR